MSNKQAIHILTREDLRPLLDKLAYDHFGYDEAGEAAKRAYDALCRLEAEGAGAELLLVEEFF